MKFYDPKDKDDLAKVEAILKKAGIEYSLVREPEEGIGPMQVHVAEEDFPHAEELLQLLRSNMEHSRYLLEGGWGLRRDTSKQLSNVAKVVGLAMPKPTEGAADPSTFAGAKHSKARDAKLGKHDKFVR